MVESGQRMRCALFDPSCVVKSLKLTLSPWSSKLCRKISKTYTLALELKKEVHRPEQAYSKQSTPNDRRLDGKLTSA